MSTCPNCATTNELSDSYCRKCGAKLESDVENARGKSELHPVANLPSTIWHTAIIAATGGWILIIFAGSALPGEVLALIFLVSWPLLPIALLKDSQEVQEHVKWPKYEWAYISCSLIWVISIIPGLVYLWKRRKLSLDENSISREELREKLKEEHSESGHSYSSRKEKGGSDGGNTGSPQDSPKVTTSVDPQASDAGKPETDESGSTQPLYFGAVVSKGSDSTTDSAVITGRMPIEWGSEFQSNDDAISLFEGFVVDTQGNPVATTTKIVEEDVSYNGEKSVPSGRKGSESTKPYHLTSQFESSTWKTLREYQFDSQSIGTTDDGGYLEEQSQPSTGNRESTETPSVSEKRGARVEPSREELLGELQSLNEQSNRQVTRGQMRAVGDYTPEDYEKEFGTWSAALEELPTVDEPSSDSDSTEQKVYSKEEVLEAIAEVIEKVDGRPDVSDMQKYGRMSPTPAYRLFDSWDQAVQEASNQIQSQGSQTSESDAEGASPVSESDSDPLSPSVATAPKGRLTGVVVDIREVREPSNERRTAEVDVVTSAGEQLTLSIWNKHNIDWEFQPGVRVRLDSVILERWNTGDGLIHKLNSTKDLSISLVGRDEDAGAETEGEDDKATSKHEAVEQLTGIGGTTESDARALVNAGYDSIPRLKEASLEELRGISELDDGIALRIKAEVG